MREKNIYIFYLVNKKSLSYIIRTLKKVLQLILLLTPNQATFYNKKTKAYQFQLWSVHSLPSRYSMNEYYEYKEDRRI
jgi:hypothetical protein